MALRYRRAISYIVASACALVSCGGGSNPATSSGDDSGIDASDAGNDGDDAYAVADSTMQGDDAGRSSDADDGSDESFAPVVLDTGADWSSWIPTCTQPLPDAGFTSLADLPLASLCAASYNGQVVEGTPPCQGSIAVFTTSGVDCGGFFLFDATTGALQAVGSGCDGFEAFSCTGGISGFVYPYQCFDYGGWPQRTNLCPDGGADAGVTDATSE